MTATCDTKKLREIFARGLTKGLGNETQTCIEGAIALACGLPLSDTPPCVAAEDRAWAIRINDGGWPSPKARSEALLPIALAQIGTAGMDRRAWVRAVVDGAIRRVFPIALRAAADIHPVAAHADALRAAADRCAAEGTPETAAAAGYAAETAAAAGYTAETVAAAAYAADTSPDPVIRVAMLREAVAVALDAYAATSGLAAEEPKP